jgi:uncharacterized paraquat-inducible protein A
MYNASIVELQTLPNTKQAIPLEYLNFNALYAMALRECRNCKKLVSSEAGKCPRCGVR